MQLEGLTDVIFQTFDDVSHATMEFFGIFEHSQFKNTPLVNDTLRDNFMFS